MSNFPDGMTSRDWDHVEGVGMGECSEPMCDYQAGDDGLCDEHDEEAERQAFTSASLSKLHRLMDDGRGPA
jgi:hypothetical protein|tara:strand:+ start:511 stop:723 length:213 start_codon:yes stop_codon:yes gene_type:complete